MANNTHNYSIENGHIGIETNRKHNSKEEKVRIMMIKLKVAYILGKICKIKSTVYYIESMKLKKIKTIIYWIYKNRILINQGKFISINQLKDIKI